MLAPASICCHLCTDLCLISELHAVGITARLPPLLLLLLMLLVLLLLSLILLFKQCCVQPPHDGSTLHLHFRALVGVKIWKDKLQKRGESFTYLVSFFLPRCQMFIDLKVV